MHRVRIKFMVCFIFSSKYVCSKVRFVLNMSHHLTDTKPKVHTSPLFQEVTQSEGHTSQKRRNRPEPKQTIIESDPDTQPADVLNIDLQTMPEVLFLLHFILHILAPSPLTITTEHIIRRCQPACVFPRQVAHLLTRRPETSPASEASAGWSDVI